MPVEAISKERTEPPAPRLHLLYHELRPGETRYSYVTDARMFERHLDLYLRLREMRSRCAWPEVTFDDGHISDLSVAAPLLEARGLTAQFFITAGWTGKRPGYMGWPELRSLHQSGQSIGAHGWTHTLLTHCSEAELKHELSNSRLMLEDKLGTSITTMSLPGGRSNRRVLAACAQAGYTRVYTSMPRVEAVPLGSTVGRLNIRGDMQPEWIASLFQPDSTVLSHLERHDRWKQAAKTLLGDGLYARLWALVNRKEPDPEDGRESAE